MRKKHMVPRLLAMFLALVLTVGSMPLNALAAETAINETVETVSEETEEVIPAEESAAAEEADTEESISETAEEEISEEAETVGTETVETETEIVETKPADTAEDAVQETVTEDAVIEETAAEEAVTEETAAEEAVAEETVADEAEAEEEMLAAQEDLLNAAAVEVSDFTAKNPDIMEVKDGAVTSSELKSRITADPADGGWGISLPSLSSVSLEGSGCIGNWLSGFEVVDAAKVAVVVTEYKPTWSDPFAKETTTIGYIKFKVYHNINIEINGNGMPADSEGNALGEVTFGNETYVAKADNIKVYEADGAQKFAVKAIEGYAANYSFLGSEASMIIPESLNVTASGNLVVSYYEASSFSVNADGEGIVYVDGVEVTSGSTVKPPYGKQEIVAVPNEGYWAKDLQIVPVKEDVAVPEVTITYENGTVTAEFDAGKEEYTVTVTFVKMPVFDGETAVVYDGQRHAFNVTEADGLEIVYVGTGDSAAYRSDKAPTEAGTYAVNALYYGYDPVNGTVVNSAAFEISKRPVKIEFIEKVGKELGEEDPEFVYGTDYIFVLADETIEGEAVVGEEYPVANFYYSGDGELGEHAIGAMLASAKTYPVNANYALKSTSGIFYIGMYDISEDYRFWLLDEEGGKESTAQYGMKFTGEEVIPAVAFEAVETTDELIEGTHYTISYVNNVKPGTQTASVVIEGNTDNHVIGKVVLPFSITVADPENLDEEYDPNEIKIDLADTDIESVSSLKIADQIYTGKAIKPEIEVYHGTTKLVLNKDYTVSYKNNTNVFVYSEGANPKKIPTVTVKGKGNYSGTQTVHFNIVKKNISELKDAVVYTDSYVYNNGKALKPVLKVKYDKVTLKANKDYTLSYVDVSGNETNTLGTAPGSFTMVVKGTGNYEGTIELPVSVVDTKNSSERAVSKLSVSVKTTTVGNSPAITVKDGKTELKAGVDYEVSFDNDGLEGDDYNKAGKQTLVIKGKAKDTAENPIVYVGTKTVTYTVKGTSLAKAATVTGWDASVRSYTGAAQKQKKVNLTLKDGSGNLTEGTDYTVTYTNNIKAGTATVIYTGIGNYQGTIKKTFKITARNLAAALADNMVKLTVEETAEFSKAGAKAAITELSYNGIALKEGTDYTVSYKNNKKVGTATATIKGKGNYAGTLVSEFEVAAQNIAELTLVLPNVVTSAKKGGYKTAPILYDVTNKALAKGKDYTITYYYTQEAAEAGTEEGMIPSSEIKEYKADDNTVWVRLQGNEAKGYSGYRVESYKIEQAKLSAAKITVNGNFWYTGEEIRLSEDKTTLAKAYNKLGFKVDCLTVTIGKGLEAQSLKLGEHYEIVEGTYRSNVNKGTASVTIRGIGAYTGVKTIKFKIVARPTWLTIFDKLAGNK